MFRKNKNQNKAQVVQAFMDHCATIIQSNFRSYQQRKYYRTFLPLYKRFKQLLYAGFLGWKTRKILKLTFVKNKINEINSLESQQTKLQRRIKKRDFSEEITRLLKNGLWLYYLSKQKKVHLSNKTIFSVNKNQAVVTKEIDLKQEFKIIPKNKWKKAVLNDQNRNIVDKQVLNKDWRQGFCLTQDKQSKIHTVKEKKSKKFENPLKTFNKAQRPKQIQVKTQKDTQPENIERNSIKCETPNYSMNHIKQFSFHTRPRDPIPTNLRSTKADKQQTEQNFKKIHVLTASHKRGLNMTLSKKSVNEIRNQSTPINQTVLQNFNTKINNQKHKGEGDCQCPGAQEVSIFNIKQNLQKNANFCQWDSKHSERNLLLQINFCQQNSKHSERNLLLQIKKDAFQKRKIQFQKKTKLFKMIALK